MSAFRLLRECCVNFEDYLNTQASLLYSAQTNKCIEDKIHELSQKLSQLSAKNLQLRSQLHAGTSEVHERISNNVDVKDDLEDIEVRHVIEQAVVRSLTQSVAAKKLLTASDSKLTPSLIERKENIIKGYNRLREKELELRQLDELLVKKEEEHYGVMQEWDVELGALGEMIAVVQPKGELQITGPLYQSMQAVIAKLEIMRYIICGLVRARTLYDWLEDPNGIFEVFNYTREENTVELFM